MPHIRSPTEITPAWLNAAFQSSGYFPVARVAACRVQPFGADFGFASQIARIQLNWDPPGNSLPESMIAKLSTQSVDTQRSQTLCEKNRTEFSFYRDVGTSAGTRVPHCWYSDLNDGDASMVLLLEDLQGARFGDAAKGCTPAEARLVVDALATLHAKWWQDPQLDAFEWLATYGKIEQQLERLSERRATFRDRFGETLSDEIREFTEAIGAEHAVLLKRVAGPPQTLIHVDVHLDNIAFLEEHGVSRAVLFDWQGVSKGLCAVDVALFLSGALPGADRRQEHDLLGHYHRKLVAGGVTNYTFDRFSHDYNICLLRWWIGTVNGLGSDYAEKWEGRQLELARQSVAHWCELLRGRTSQFSV